MAKDKKTESKTAIPTDPSEYVNGPTRAELNRNQGGTTTDGSVATFPSGTGRG